MTGAAARLAAEETAEPIREVRPAFRALPPEPVGRRSEGPMAAGAPRRRRESRGRSLCWLLIAGCILLSAYWGFVAADRIVRSQRLLHAMNVTETGPFPLQGAWREIGRTGMVSAWQRRAGENAPGGGSAAPAGAARPGEPVVPDSGSEAGPATIGGEDLRRSGPGDAWPPLPIDAPAPEITDEAAVTASVTDSPPIAPQAAPAPAPPIAGETVALPSAGADAAADPPREARVEAKDPIGERVMTKGSEPKPPAGAEKSSGDLPSASELHAEVWPNLPVLPAIPEDIAPRPERVAEQPAARARIARPQGPSPRASGNPGTVSVGIDLRFFETVRGTAP